MPIPSIIFYIFATALILAALTVVFAKNPLYNVLSLVCAIFCLSSIFMLLEAYFVGVILVLVYAGAVLVFFLFVVMCLNLNTDTFTPTVHSRFRFFGFTAAILFFSIITIIIKSYTSVVHLGASSLRGTIENLGQSLFTDYLLPFELTSLLLLIAIFGIVSLAKGAFKSS